MLNGQLGEFDSSKDALTKLLDGDPEADKVIELWNRFFVHYVKIATLLTDCNEYLATKIDAVPEAKKYLDRWKERNAKFAGDLLFVASMTGYRARLSCAATNQRVREFTGLRDVV